MRSLQWIVAACLLLVVGAPLNAQDQSADEQSENKPKKKFPTITELLPHREVKADVVQARSSPKVSAITKKLQDAVTKNQVWWKKYVKDNANIRPLPYHENMGVTKEEYSLLLNSASLMRLVKIAETTLVPKKTGDMLELTIKRVPEGVSPLTFDLKKGSLKTPIGTVEQSTQRDSGNQAGLIGHHLSYNWKKTFGDPKTGNFKLIALTLGRPTKTGNTFFQYRITEMKDGKPVVNANLLLFVDRAKVGP